MARLRLTMPDLPSSSPERQIIEMKQVLKLENIISSRHLPGDKKSIVASHLKLLVEKYSSEVQQPRPTMK